MILLLCSVYFWWHEWWQTARCDWSTVYYSMQCNNAILCSCILCDWFRW